MKKAKVVAGLLILVCSLVLVGGVLASNGQVIERSVFGSGGQQVTDGSYILNGTFGEPIASDLALETNYGLSSGYWAGGGITGGGVKVYLPIILKES